MPTMPTVNGVQPESLAEWRELLETTKKEVREIKAIESQLKWSMQREEKKEKVSEAKATVDEMRDWRWKQNQEMKVYVAEKAKTSKVTELKESKSFQEFKRETKAAAREETRKQIQEEYLQDKDYSQWRAELAKLVNKQEKEAVNTRVEDYLEQREIRNFQKQQEKIEAEEDRMVEQALEMAAEARKIEREKEQLLQTLQHSRAAQRAPQTSNLPPSALLGELS